MKRISLFVLFICTIFSCLSAQTGKENERIKQNYIRSIIGMDEEKQPYLQLLSKIPPEKEVSDQNVIELQQLYPIRQEEIHRLISTIRGDGSWPDINYADTKRSGWEPKQHAERILKLTKYYAREQENVSAQEISAVVSIIHQAMKYWFVQKPVCKNWWYNQIGIPRTLGPAFLLFETEMTEKEKQEAIRAAMNALPVDFREILELRVVQQLPYEQIAQIMDLPVGTVKSRLARARLQLKKRLDAGNFFETGTSKHSE